MLKGWGNGDSSSKNHWIVWDGELKLVNGQRITNETNLGEFVSLWLFSWGEVKDNSLRTLLTLGEFLSHTFGGYLQKHHD